MSNRERGSRQIAAAIVPPSAGRKLARAAMHRPHGITAAMGAMTRSVLVPALRHVM